MWFSKILLDGKGQNWGRKPGMSIEMKDEVGKRDQIDNGTRVRSGRKENI